MDEAIELNRNLEMNYDLLKEAVRAEFRLLALEVKPPQSQEDLADLILIAERSSGQAYV